MKDKINWIYIVLLIGIGSGLYFHTFSTLKLYENAQLPKYKFPDSKHYEGASRALYLNNFKPSASRPIGYPLIIGVPYLFNASKETVQSYIYVIQFLMWLFSVLGIYLILKRRFLKIIAFAAALLFAYNVSNIVITNQNLTETFLVFLLVYSFYFLDKYLFDKSFGALVFALFLTSYSAIVKPVMEYWVYLVLLFTCYQIWRYTPHKLKYFGLAFLAIVSTLGFQKTLMKAQYGTFQTSLIGKAALYTCIGARAKSLEKGIPVIKEIRLRRKAKKKIPGKGTRFERMDSLAMTDFKDQLQNNTKNVFKGYYLNVRENSISGSGFISRVSTFKSRKTKFQLYNLSKRQNRFYSFITIFILPLLLFTLLLLKRSRTNILYWLAVFAWLVGMYIVVFSGLSLRQGDRFHIVIVPGTIIALLIGIKLIIPPLWLDKLRNAFVASPLRFIEQLETTKT